MNIETCGAVLLILFTVEAFGAPQSYHRDPHFEGHSSNGAVTAAQTYENIDEVIETPFAESSNNDVSETQHGSDSSVPQEYEQPANYQTDQSPHWTHIQDGVDSSQENQTVVICEIAMVPYDWSEAPYGSDSLEFGKYQPQENSDMEQSSEWTDTQDGAASSVSQESESSKLVARFRALGLLDPASKSHGPASPSGPRLMPDLPIFPNSMPDLPLFPNSMPDPEQFPNSESSSEFPDASESSYDIDATDDPKTSVDGDSPEPDNDTYNSSEFLKIYEPEIFAVSDSDPQYNSESSQLNEAETSPTIL